MGPPPAQPPPSRPSRRSPLRLLLVCLGTALALTAALALPTSHPTYEERYRPLATKGKVGQTLTTRDFRIRVKQVVVARSLAAPVRDAARHRTVRRTVGTEGVWVIIVADVGATREKISSANGLEGGQFVAADGSIYRKESAMPSIDFTKNLDDMIPLGPPRTERFYFQVPRDRLSGGRFLVTRESLKWWDDPKPWEEQWFLPAANVDLGFDDPDRAQDALGHAVERYPVPGQV